MGTVHIRAVTRLLGCVAAALMLDVPANAVPIGPCPSSLMSVPGSATTTPTTDTWFGVSGPEGSWIRGDHSIAEYSLHHSGSLTPTDVIARDRYDMVGVPSGTRVSVLLVLLVEGWTYTGGCGGSGCCGSLVATIRAGTDTSQVSLVGHSFGGRSDFSGAAVLPVVLVAGNPATVEVELRARRCPGGSHSVDATGRLTFQGSDPNAAVVSCKGLGPVPVPVRRSSWGETRVRYR